MSISASLLVGFISVCLMFRRPSQASGLAYFAAYVFYFCFGPIIGYLITGEIFRGTVLAQLSAVSTLYAIVLFALFAADLTVRPGKNHDSAPRWDINWHSWTYYFGLAVVAVYGAIMAVVIYLQNPVDKVQAISLGGPFHYPYMLVSSLMVVGTILGWTSTRSRKKLLLFFWISYLGYCLAVGERDFIFGIFILLIHNNLRSQSGRSAKVLVFGGIAAIVGGSLIFTLRGNDEFTLSTVLSQGSTVFVDSFVLDWIHNGGVFEPNSMLSVLGVDTPTALGSWSEWLSYMYTGVVGSEAQYGFSLISEAYINAGALGVFCFFYVAGLLMKYATIKSVESEYWHMFSVLFMYHFMYNVRGHLYALTSALTYGIVIILMIRAGHKRTEPPREQTTNSIDIPSHAAEGTSARFSDETEHGL